MRGDGGRYKTVGRSAARAEWISRNQQTEYLLSFINFPRMTKEVITQSCLRSINIIINSCRSLLLMRKKKKHLIMVARCSSQVHGNRMHSTYRLRSLCKKTPTFF